MPGGRYAAVTRGVPDILCLREGRFIGIEVKTPGGHLSDDQAMFGRDIVKNGGDFFAVHSVEEVIASGL
jgi:hypothetical protein